MIRIKLSLGKTINMGNFESLRIDVGIEADVNGTIGGEIERSFEGLDEKLSRVLDWEIKKQIKEMKK